MPTRRRTPHLPIAALAALAALASTACDRRVTPSAPTAPSPSAIVRHDFGSLRHGDVARVDLDIPLPASEGPLIPVGFQRNCTCAHHQFVLVDRATGAERLATGQPLPQFAVGPGERLVLRIELHTGHQDAADQARLTVPGSVILQEHRDGFPRHLVGVEFTYAIDAPIAIEPYARLDLGQMPRAVSYSQTLLLRGDDGPIALSNVRCLERDPRAPDRTRDVADCAVEAAVVGDRVEIRVRFKADPARLEGPFAFEVVADTDLSPPYRVRVPVSGSVVGDVQVSPPGQFSFGVIDFDRPAEQVLVVTDHDIRREARFLVASIVALDGADLSPHFEVSLDDVPHQRRSTHVTLRYRGGLSGARSFRGELHLAKDGAGTIARVPFVGFDRKRS